MQGVCLPFGLGFTMEGIGKKHQYNEACFKKKLKHRIVDLNMKKRGNVGVLSIVRHKATGHEIASRRLAAMICRAGRSRRKG